MGRAGAVLNLTRDQRDLASLTGIEPRDGTRLQEQKHTLFHYSRK